MKEIWTLIIKTSLPGACECIEGVKTTVEAFDSFEKARSAFRSKLKDYAFSKNAMFDGEGKITSFCEYYKNMSLYQSKEKECKDKEILTSSVVKDIQNALTAAFAGNDIELKPTTSVYCDSLLEVHIEDNVLRVSANLDGPMDDCAPTLNTNIFSMKKEQDYYLYVDDMFGQNASSVLSMDLFKTQVQ